MRDSLESFSKVIEMQKSCLKINTDSICENSQQTRCVLPKTSINHTSLAASLCGLARQEKKNHLVQNPREEGKEIFDNSIAKKKKTRLKGKIWWEWEENIVNNNNTEALT